MSLEVHPNFTSDFSAIRSAKILDDSFELLIVVIIVAFKNNDDIISTFSKLDEYAPVSPLL